MSSFPAKDPADTLDEKFNWGQWLASGETITDATVTALPSGLTISAVTITTGTDASGASVTAGGVAFIASGGAVASKYEITCQITTSSGNLANRMASLQVKDL